MGFTLRPFETADFSDLLPVFNSFYLEPATLESLRRDHEQDLRDRKVVQQTTALDESGRIVGYSHLRREYGDWDKGRLGLWVIVAAPMRGRGVGTLLYNAALRCAHEQEAYKLDSLVRDSDAQSLGFAERRGFRIDRHMFGSRLDVEAFDEQPFAGVIDAVKATGIRFFSMAELVGTPEAEHKLFELNKYVDSEIPGERLFPSFEEFREIVFQAPWYRPDGQIIAADGDRWVGMSAVGFFPDTGSARVMITGVDREYRGRKIALALKLLTIRAARRHGVKHILAGNDTHNAPMLAINEKLGFQRMRGMYYLLKVVTSDK